MNRRIRMRRRKRRSALNRPPSSTRRLRRFPPRPIVAPQAIDGIRVGNFGSGVVTTTSIVPPKVLQAASAVVVDTSRYENAITITAANVKQVYPSSGPANNQELGGGGNLPIGQDVARTAGDPVASTSSSPATLPAFVVPDSPDAGMTSPSRSPKIRPMTLATISRSTASPALAGKAMTYDLSGSGSSSGDGSGSEIPPPPPCISGGWGQGWICPDPNDQSKEVIADGVPVGAVFNCSVLAPGGYSIDPSTISWGGGTYKSYFSNPPTDNVVSDPSLTSMSVTPIYATDRIRQSFQAIADPDTSTMVISVTCSYFDPNSSLSADLPPVTTTLTAQVVKPTLATITATAGIVQFSTGVTKAVIKLDPPTEFEARGRHRPIRRVFHDLANHLFGT